MKNGVPRVFNVHALDAQAMQRALGRGSHELASPDGKRWFRARTEGYWGWCWRRRFKLAWRVFTGEMDALSWTFPKEPQP